ncbi:magnesium and cobalt transport protein CorA [Promicromonospora soli]|uniref:Magnesium transport protein CorA n=1 Tax=Promicromonospora soli TaxID=2035533 RepID=A0A919FP39_9MICO|nr:magnesium and cobalt transport protein CorA [Promicromonospora soli]GHH69816.1 magnesium transport protein CorA [Promicromonospora soli]
MSIMDNAVYVDGKRTANPASLEETCEITRERHGIAWVDLSWPTPAEIEAVAEEFSLHPLAVEDAIHAHQRPKIEHYDDVLFVVLHPARSVDEDGDGHIDRVEFGEVHAWVGPDFVVTIRRSVTPDLAAMRAGLEQDPDLLRLGPIAILAALLDQVVDTYRPVVTRLRRDIDQVEDQLFSRDPEVSFRIYEATREVIGLQRATSPLVDILRELLDGESETGESETGSDVAQDHRYVELHRNLRNVLDHAIKHAETSDTFRSLLTNTLNVHSTLVTQEQNEESRRLTEISMNQDEQVKKISAWAAILFAPSLIGTIYGMNFEHMPELTWTFGYPLALATMVGLGGIFYWIFKRVGWL